jgi:hypothetical protein
VRILVIGGIEIYQFPAISMRFEIYIIQLSLNFIDVLENLAFLEVIIILKA